MGVNGWDTPLRSPFDWLKQMPHLDPIDGDLPKFYGRNGEFDFTLELLPDDSPFLTVEKAEEYIAGQLFSMTARPHFRPDSPWRVFDELAVEAKRAWHEELPLSYECGNALISLEQTTDLVREGDSLQQHRATGWALIYLHHKIQFEGELTLVLGDPIILHSPTKYIDMSGTVLCEPPFNLRPTIIMGHCDFSGALTDMTAYKIRTVADPMARLQSIANITNHQPRAVIEQLDLVAALLSNLL